MNGLKPLGRRSKSLMQAIALGALFALQPANAQTVPAPAARGPAVIGAPVPANQAPAQPVVAPLPPPLPPVMWDPVSAQDLVYYIQQIGADGLNPADYDPAGLTAAIQAGDPLALSAAATDRFNRVSSDLALGHVKKPGRLQWFVVDNDLDAAEQDALLRNALATHQLATALNGLLPTHPQYVALKAALELTPASDSAKRNRIRLNMDRWRWLPRELGEKYIIVNVPGFHATLVENGVNRWKQRAIAGATKTPTPQLSAMAVGVMLNPSWEVPPSITHEVSGKKGFVPVMKDGKLIRWSQPPGPTNALGQVKFVMYNPHNIYLHDTNARSRFTSRMRALSHGCIRTEHIMDLATELLGDDGGTWTPEKIKAQLATGKTRQANFVKPLPVYIVYFSAAALNDGKIVDYQDLYGRDGKAMAALNMKDGGAGLAGPKPKAKPDQVAAK
ncbi:MAG TPA: L,D-transpeptidase family protein [Sphingomicrobium sp.]|nr:L,D-transpeptidase family protein [Sphingomicrobium sp.]